MAKRKLPKLSYAEHVIAGTKLKEIRKFLMDLGAHRALREVEILRCQLDSELCASLSLTDDSWRGVYYGNN